MLSKQVPLGIYEKALPGGECWLERLQLAKELGFDFVEMSVDETDARLARLDWNREQRLALVAAIADTGIRVPSMCLSAHRRFPLGSEDDAVREQGLEIMRKAASKSFGEVQAVLSIEDLHALQAEIGKIHIDKELERYIVQIIAATREPARFGLDDIAESIMFGASPRASIDLYKAAKAKAFLRGNDFVSPADIGYVIHNVLRHRIVLSYEARAKGIHTDEIISAIIETLPIP